VATGHFFEFLMPSLILKYVTFPWLGLLDYFYFKKILDCEGTPNQVPGRNSRQHVLPELALRRDTAYFHAEHNRTQKHAANDLIWRETVKLRKELHRSFVVLSKQNKLEVCRFCNRLLV
jgi:hypothetical protein